VDCALPHAEESVGAIDMTQKFKDKFPSANDQDGFLQPACTKLAADYSGGGNVISDKKLVVIWNNLTQQSWSAGTRKVACNLAAVLPDKSGYAPIIGSVKGPVQIGDKPAPPAQLQVPPGAPAPGSGSDSARDDNSDDSDSPPEPAQDQPSIAPPVPLPANPLPANPLGGGDNRQPTNPLGGDNRQPTNPLGGAAGQGTNPLGGAAGQANPLGGDKPAELPKPAGTNPTTPG
jgi:hypothetical protein